MSAWPEAVWITKQIKHNLEKMSSIEIYQENLNEWTEQLETAQEHLSSVQSAVDSMSGEAEPPIIAQDNDGQPDGIEEQINNNRIWFVFQQGQENNNGI